MQHRPNGIRKAINKTGLIAIIGVGKEQLGKYTSLIIQVIISFKSKNHTKPKEKKESIYKLQ